MNCTLLLCRIKEFVLCMAIGGHNCLTNPARYGTIISMKHYQAKKNFRLIYKEAYHSDATTASTETVLQPAAEEDDEPNTLTESTDLTGKYFKQQHVPKTSV